MCVLLVCVYSNILYACCVEICFHVYVGWMTTWVCERVWCLDSASQLAHQLWLPALDPWNFCWWCCSFSIPLDWRWVFQCWTSRSSGIPPRQPEDLRLVFTIRWWIWRPWCLDLWWMPSMVRPQCSTVLNCLVSYCIVLYCIVLYYCISLLAHVACTYTYVWLLLYV